MEEGLNFFTFLGLRWVLAWHHHTAEARTTGAAVRSSQEGEHRSRLEVALDKPSLLR